MKACVSKHGNKRLRDRCGASKKSADKLADDALKYGIRHNETAGQLNRYITSLYFRNEEANNIRIYHEKVYIFVGNILITVLNLPHSFHKVSQKIMKRKKIEESECKNEWQQMDG